MVAFDLSDGDRPRRDWRRLLHDGLPAAAMAVLLCLFVLLVSVLLREQDRPGALMPMGIAGVAATDDTRLTIAGGARSHAFARLTINLPAAERDGARLAVWIARDPVDALWLQSGSWRSQALDFYRPSPHEGLFPGDFLVPLPETVHHDAALELHAVGTMPVALQARLVPEDQAARWMQRTLALQACVYTGTFLLAFIAVGLLWTLREPLFLLLFGAALTAGLLFAASNGHLYALPGLGRLGALRGQGIWALSTACLAGMLAAVQQVAWPPQWPWLGRACRATVAGLLVSTAVLLLSLEVVEPWAHWLAATGVALTGLVAVLLLAGALRRRVTMVLPALALMVVALAAGSLRGALSLGLVADAPWIRHGYQVVLLCLLAVLALALIVPIGAYRQQRDRERDARVDSERRMEREAARAGLARLLQSRLRELSPADVEWTAFRLMLEHLLPHLPAGGGAVVTQAYHGRDVVVTDPIDDRELTGGLDGQRLAQLKRLAVSGRAFQHDVQVGGARRREAVIPLGMPLPAWGTLLLHRDDDLAFSDEELALATEFVRLTVLHADEAVVTHALKRTVELDALTGTFNRRSIDQCLAREFQLPRGGNLSLLFVDIDHFKRVNDVYGHACGDHCLRQVAQALRGALRAGDLLGRYGGEEFVVLLPGTDATTARGIAEALRVAVEQRVIDWQGAQHQLTVSIGVATRAPGEAAAAPVIDRADRALYAAKRGGRNRISVSPAIFLS